MGRNAQIKKYNNGVNEWEIKDTIWPFLTSYATGQHAKNKVNYNVGMSK